MLRLVLNSRAVFAQQAAVRPDRRSPAEQLQPKDHPDDQPQVALAFCLGGARGKHSCLRSGQLNREQAGAQDAHQRQADQVEQDKRQEEWPPFLRGLGSRPKIRL